MPALFKKKSNASYEYANQLHQFGLNEPFNPDTQPHKDLLTNCSNAVKEKLLMLQSIDKKMTIGFAVGVAAFALSWLPGFGMLAIAGIAYGAYQMGQRAKAYNEYEEALENLCNCCRWALGERVSPEIKTCPAVTNMMETLAPLTNATQLAAFIDDSVEDELIEQAAKIKGEGAEFLGTTLDKEKTDLFYKIYGYEQGGAFAILEGIGYAIKSAAVSVKNFFTGNTAAEQPRDQTHSSAF